MVLATEKFKLSLSIVIFYMILMSNEGQIFTDLEFCLNLNDTS